ncbi:MAG: ferritin-like domain-containing protein [Gammaproteobacteria bacterium]|nr:ferritin-like domain-containing protein [Gammaproteobacteria bacterium]
MAELYRQLENALLDPDYQSKCELTATIHQAWRQGSLQRQANSDILSIDDPGRPPRPVLVDPRALERRSVASPEGRIRLLHAFAHIEFNAINIALDAAYRYRDMPEQFISDWLLVATEEARHFRLLEHELRQRGSYYGAHHAHRGLWDMVCKTRHDVLHRMALVPRVMEARGLDVTPAMIAKFKQLDDRAAVEILEVIYRDEIGHVRIGNHWYGYLCGQRGLDAENTFRELVTQYMDGKLRGPFNWPARIEAGFQETELSALEQGI